MASLNESWEDKLAKTQEIHIAREQALEELGISLDKDRALVGVHAPKKWPHLVNLNEVRKQKSGDLGVLAQHCSASGPFAKRMSSVLDSRRQDNSWKHRIVDRSHQAVKPKNYEGTLRTRQRKGESVHRAAGACYNLGERETHSDQRCYAS